MSESDIEIYGWRYGLCHIRQRRERDMLLEGTDSLCWYCWQLPNISERKLYGPLGLTYQPISNRHN
jgi:hypothetical protein